MIVEVSVHDVIDLHDDETGQPGVRDRSLIEGAVAAAFQTFDGKDLYRTVVEKAAKLLEGISRAHGFVDGNKRTAWVTCVAFLDINGLVLRDADQIMVAGFVEVVSQGHMAVEDVALWLNDQLE